MKYLVTFKKTRLLKMILDEDLDEDKAIEIAENSNDESGDIFDTEYKIERVEEVDFSEKSEKIIRISSLFLF